MTKTMTIGNAIVDTDKLRGYNSEALDILQQKENLDVEYKDLINEVAKQTKLKKAVVSGYFKARHKAKAAEVVEKGELYNALNEALDD
jgi:hypothetical protein